MSENKVDYSEEVVCAAQWLAEQNPIPSPMVPVLRERFSLTALQATEACALSNKYRVWRKAHG